jgi:ribosomal protein S18 acetylase RimI-like enzyme
MRLPDGYRTLRPALADVDEILELVHASELAALGHTDYQRGEVEEALSAPGVDPAADSWLVRDGDGRLVGWGFLEPSGWFCDAYARPGEGPSVQAVLIDLLLRRVSERAGESAIARSGALPVEEQYIGVLAAAGFEFERQQARMTRPLTGDEQPSAPIAGYTVRTATAADLPACDEVLRAAFDNATVFSETPNLVLAECLVAETDGGLAGVLLSTEPLADTGEGWVKWLGVSPEHRRRGIGGLLLSTAMAANARLGRPSVGLGVDTSSPTKAYDLYERLGFTAAYRANIYRRTVAGGVPVIGPEFGPPLEELLELYGAVGWSAYTDKPELLRAGIAGSSHVVTARLDGRLVGLARATSDDATICYLQDVLVHPDAQRRGIGRALVQAVLDRYSAVRQKVLLTDDEPAQRAFYESLGYAEIRDFGPGTLRSFVRFDG